MYLPSIFVLFFFNDTATTEIYTLSLHDALPILGLGTLVRGPREELLGGPEFDQVAEVEEAGKVRCARRLLHVVRHDENRIARSEEHTSELQSRLHLVCRLLLEKKKRKRTIRYY